MRDQLNAIFQPLGAMPWYCARCEKRYATRAELRLCCRNPSAWDRYVESNDIFGPDLRRLSVKVNAADCHMDTGANELALRNLDAALDMLGATDAG